MRYKQDTPITIRYNNPGAIQYKDTIQWQGQTGKGYANLLTFETVTYGARAQMKSLLHYYTVHGCHTIREIVSRWSGAKMSTLRYYILYVGRHSMVAPGELIVTYGQLIEVALAMANFEAGRNYPAHKSILSGYRMAIAGHSTATLLPGAAKLLKEAEVNDESKDI